MRNDFAVFILTHGRPDRVLTYNSLRRCGYTGRIVLVCDNEDDNLQGYQERYGDQVYVFDKAKAAEYTDTAETSGVRNAVVYARNASFEIARELGVTYFMQADDDYSSWLYKFRSDATYCEKTIKSLDAVFEAMLDFFIDSGATAFCMAQNGDYIGGQHNQHFAGAIKLSRKAMNTFLCSVDRPFKFLGKINEDVNAYTYLQRQGVLFFTHTGVSVSQGQTQAHSGGLTEIYLAEGTYVKSFYSVIVCPSAVTVRDMGHIERRIHHNVKWSACAPEILNERYRKAG